MYMFFKRIDRADFRLSLNFNTNVKNITPIAIVNSLLTSLVRVKCRKVVPYEYGKDVRHL